MTRPGKCSVEWERRLWKMKHPDWARPTTSTLVTPAKSSHCPLVKRKLEVDVAAPVVPAWYRIMLEYDPLIVRCLPFSSSHVVIFNEWGLLSFLGDFRTGVQDGGSYITMIEVMILDFLSCAHTGNLVTFLAGNLARCIKSLEYSHALLPKNSTLKNLPKARVRNVH